MRRRETEYQQRIAAAWHAEAFHRTKKLPSLAEVIHPKKRRGISDPDKMVDAIRAWLESHRKE